MTLKTVYGPPPDDEERIEADESEIGDSLLKEKAEPIQSDGWKCCL